MEIEGNVFFSLDERQTNVAKKSDYNSDGQQNMSNKRDLLFVFALESKPAAKTWRGEEGRGESDSLVPVQMYVKKGQKCGRKRENFGGRTRERERNTHAKLHN